MATYGSQAVAPGGMGRALQAGARLSLKTSQLRVRVRQADDLVDVVLAQCEHLDDEIRSRIPLSECGCSQTPGHDHRSRPPPTWVGSVAHPTTFAFDKTSTLRGELRHSKPALPGTSA